jgi:hypothetical protein
VDVRLANKKAAWMITLESGLADDTQAGKSLLDAIAWQILLNGLIHRSVKLPETHIMADGRFRSVHIPGGKSLDVTTVIQEHPKEVFHLKSEFCHIYALVSINCM